MKLQFPGKPVIEPYRLCRILRAGIKQKKMKQKAAFVVSIG
jgi:hypothetical protein